MNSKKIKILITGGAGFIGSQLAHFFDKKDEAYEVMVLDIFRNEECFSNGNLKSFGHFKNLIGFRGEVLEGDITNEESFKQIKYFNPDIIYHEAAISDTTVMDQSIMIKANLNAFKNLLELSKKLEAKIIYASSGATYGDAKSPQSVWEEEKPKNVYGFSKLMMDYLALKYIKNYQMHIVGLRYFNVYGQGEFFKNQTSSMILQFGHQILKGNTPKLFEGSENIKRDFVYIKDVINANFLAINGKPGIYNVGTGIARSFQDIADILQENLKTNLGNIYIKNPHKAYQFFTQANISQTTKSLGYSPKFTLEEGIKDYLPEIIRLYNEEINV